MLPEKKKKKHKMWSIFEKEYIMHCSSAERIARNGRALR
jgi:hypothetical protein